MKKLKNVKKPVASSGGGSVIGKMKADLEMDTLQFSSRLRQMLPTVKSFNKMPGRTKSQRSPRRSKAITAQSEVGASPYPKSAKMDASRPFSSLMAPPPMGEKLITVGGYIISLQSPRDDITSVVKPRISTDKEGLEVEIKITGCKPTDIRFERRYETLIVIGVTFPPPPPPTTPIPRKSTFRGGSSKANADLQQEPGPSTAVVTATPTVDGMDEIQELVNIFVPKTISINQIFISSPDAKGRIFVKGP